MIRTGILKSRKHEQTGETYPFAATIRLGDDTVDFMVGNLTSIPLKDRNDSEKGELVTATFEFTPEDQFANYVPSSAIDVAIRLLTKTKTKTKTKTT